MIYKKGLLRWNKPGSIFLLARLVDTKAAVFEQSSVAGHTPGYLMSEKQVTWVSLLLETFEWKSNKDQPTSCWPWMQMERDLANSHPPHTWLVKDHKKEHLMGICSHSPRSRAQWTSGRSRSTWRCPCCSRAGRSNDPRKLRSSCTVLWKKKVSQLQTYVDYYLCHMDDILHCYPFHEEGRYHNALGLAYGWHNDDIHD